MALKPIRRLTWCDGCLKRRLCATLKSGVIYNGNDCEIHICQWCRGVETRRNGTRKPLQGEKKGGTVFEL